jgi:hypothetical protein
MSFQVAAGGGIKFKTAKPFRVAEIGPMTRNAQGSKYQSYRRLIPGRCTGSVPG